jgi:DnaJ-class molecular chaperone
MNGQISIAPSRETITCAFCGGKGTDPYNCMSSRSVCGSCHGRGTLNVPYPHRRCTFCEGTGSHKTYRCPICGGAGVNPEPVTPTRPCDECGGCAFDSSSGLPCLTCRGLGYVPD